jgi:hypothetical protein
VPALQGPPLPALRRWPDVPLSPLRADEAEEMNMTAPKKIRTIKRTSAMPEWARWQFKSAACGLIYSLTKPKEDGWFGGMRTVKPVNCGSSSYTVAKNWRQELRRIVPRTPPKETT